MSDANGRRSTPASMTDEHPTPIQAQIKDINLSDSKTKKNVLTNQTDIFGLLDMSPPERKKNTDLNPEVACFQPSEQTSATGSQHSGSPPRLTKEGSRVPMYKVLSGRTWPKSNLFKPKFDYSMTENHDLSQPE